MSHFFDKRDQWGNGFSLWIILAMVLFVPLIGLSLKHIELENDVAGWLPDDDPQSRVLSWYSNHFPIKDTLLVSWDHCSLDDPRINLFVHKLRGIQKSTGEWYDGNPYVAEVHTPLEALSKIADQGVEPTDAVERMTGLLVGPGLLRVKLTEAGQTHLNQVQEEIRSRAKAELGVDLYFEGVDQKITQAELEQKVSPKLLARAQHGFSAGDYLDLNPEDDSEEESSDQEMAELRPVEEFLNQQPYDFQIGWPLMHVQKDLSKQVEELVATIKTTQFPNETPIKDTFYSPGSRAALSINLSHYANPESDSSEAKKNAIASLRADAAACAIPAESLRIGGSPYAGAELSEFVSKALDNPEALERGEYAKVSPIGMSTLVAVLLAFIMLRSFRLASLVLIVSLYTTLLTVSFVPVTGGSLNMVLIVMPTLLTVLTLSAAIHVANYWKHAAQEDIHTAVVQAVRMAWQPCALASITTAIGLLSLTTSPLSPVRDFGIYSAVGCLVSLLMVLFGLPALLQYWPALPPKIQEVNRSPWRNLANVLYRYRTLVTLACLTVMVASSWGLNYFTTETKVIRYFPDDARIVEDYNYLEENLAGIIPIDTVLIFNNDVQEDTLFSDRMEMVRHVQNAIKTHPEISGTVSLATFQPEYNPPPESEGSFKRRSYIKKANSIRNYILEPTDEEDGQHDALKYFNVAHEATEFNQAGDELWRVSAQVSIMSDMDYGQLTDELTAKINEAIKADESITTDVQFKVTGMVPLFLRTQQAVLESLIKSFGLAFLLIGGVMIILLKNPLAGILSMLPNILPVGMVFGLISWYGMPVDIGTMITASVALGIAVDGTLHLLTWFREGISAGKTRQESIVQALEHCGPAMWHTSAVVGVGLLMLAPADLLLVCRFGLLMAALVGTALVADVIFLPALLAGPLGALIERTVRRDPLSGNKGEGDPKTYKPRFRIVSTTAEQSRTEEAG
ncbi:MAG: hypothetical protein CMJ46_08100 [Planctomyces sp.]|nr:hypothetical protein [Planctomyces sp.]